MSSKPGRSAGRRTAGPCAENPRETPLFRPQVGISAGSAGRSDHRGVAGIGRRRMHLRIDARWRTQYAVGPRQSVAERLTGFPGCRALRGHGAMSGRGLHRRAIAGVRGRRRGGLRRRRRRQRRRLGTGGGGCRRQQAAEKERVFRSHTGRTASRRGCSAGNCRLQDLR
jgi:hypothetical protein